MLSYSFDFTYPVTYKGLHLGDVDVSCDASIVFEQNGSWYVDEWHIKGVKDARFSPSGALEISYGEIAVDVRRERDPVAESLRRAIDAEWTRNRPIHALEIERIVRAAIADGGSDYHYERSREAA